MAKEMKHFAQQAKKQVRKRALQRLLIVAQPDLWRIGLGFMGLAANAVTNLSFPWIMGKALDSVDAGAAETRFIAVGSTIIFLTGSVASWVRIYFLGTATENIAARLRQMLFNSYLEKDVEFFDDNTRGELITILDTDVGTSAEALTEKIASGLRSLNSSVNGSILLYLTSPKLCAISLSVVPLVGIGAMSLSRYSRRLADRVRTLKSTVMSYALERFTAFSTVRLNGREDFEKEKYSDFMGESCEANTSRFFAQGAFMGFIGIATNLSLLAVLRVGGSMIAKKEITPGSLIRFAVQTAFVGLGFSGLSTCYSDLVKAADATARVFDMIDKNEEAKVVGSGVDEARLASRSSMGSLCDSRSLSPTTGSDSMITFVDVDFWYATRPEKVVLSQFCVSIPRKKITCFIGKSGGGKSTVASLISGLYRPKAGAIEYSFCEDFAKRPYFSLTVSSEDGDRAQNRAQFRELNKHIAVVEQSTSSLLSGSIAENIAYGKIGATAREIESASRAAGAHDFITQFPNGYQTQVGESGGFLSGGQRARIAIARALIRDPVCLLFDEATSALDADSESEIIDVLHRLKRTKTIVIFTHSEAVKRIADVIHLIDNGAITYSGTVSQE